MVYSIDIVSHNDMLLSLAGLSVNNTLLLILQSCMCCKEKSNMLQLFQVQQKCAI